MPLAPRPRRSLLFLSVVPLAALACSPEPGPGPGPGAEPTPIHVDPANPAWIEDPALADMPDPETGVSGVRKANNGTNGDPDYCNGAVRCTGGEGDCDSNTECVTPLVCGTDNGARFGQASTNDVCVPSHCTNRRQDEGEEGIDCGLASGCGTCNPTCSGTNGADNYCVSGCPCAAGGGDCDTNWDCRTGLICGADIGARFNMPMTHDVCVPSHCTNRVSDPAFGETGVDCGGVCGACVCPGTNGDGSFCTPGCTCSTGEGDCDVNADCDTGLVCGVDNGGRYGLNPTIDACVPASCNNRVLDPGEESPDCGGPCGGACTCGNGIRDTAVGEVCDDGNEDSGDGCSGICRFEGANNEVEPNDARAQATATGLSGVGQATRFGVLNNPGDVDYYRFDLPAGTPMFEVTVRTYGRAGEPNTSCNGDSYVHLEDAGGAPITENDDGGPELCSLISAFQVPPGTYFVRVRPYNGFTPTHGYYLDVIAAPASPCGNRALDPGEECDDGNRLNGDGCDAACFFECGNNLLDPGEQCDDGNRASGDGCSDTCQSEGCGNGSAEPPEQCDDGNATSGDGCSASCQYEVPNHEIEPNDGLRVATDTGLSDTGFVTFYGVLNNGADDDYYRFDAPGNRGFTARTYGRAGQPGSCNGDSVIHLLDANGVELAASDDNGMNLCSWIDGFGPLSAGTYYLHVRPYAPFTATHGYFLDLQLLAPPVCGNSQIEQFEECDDGNTNPGDGCDGSCQRECGNGIRDTAVGEVCDDGNELDGDGCASTCDFEPGPHETEPNDTRQTATPTGVSDFGMSRFFGVLNVPADSDFYSFTVPAAPSATSIAVSGRAPGGCSGDSMLRVYDAAGALIASNDEGASPPCPSLGALPLAPGAYTVEVLFAGAPATHGYDLEIQINPPPACGNCQREPGEQCDDGNTNPADGCSATCQIEGVLPDLTVDVNQLVSSMFISTEFFAPESCAVAEACVNGTGNRRLLRFDTMTPNYGNGDFLIGDPNGNPNMTFGQCHGHYHYEGYARYELLNAAMQPVVNGAKQAFCLLDSTPVIPNAPPRQFHCGYQGITRGWADIYGAGLDCQWIDITGIAPGDYFLQVRLNDNRTIVEASYCDNVVTVPVTIP